MQALVDRLRTLGFFQRFSDEVIKEIASRARWYSLPGGEILFTEGSTPSAVYFVLSGRLVVVRGGSGGEEVVGYVRAGEPVGEMALLSGEVHSGSVFALRDTEIAALDTSEAARLFAREAEFAGAVARIVLARARRPGAAQNAPKVMALISTSPSIDLEMHAKAILKTIERYGRRAIWIADPAAATAVAAFDAIERSHDVILLTARVGDSFEYKFALRHADRFFIFARRDARPPRPFLLDPTETSQAQNFRLVDLVMLQEGERSGSIVDWVDAIDADRAFQVSGPRTEARLARAMAGSSIGLVLSGGGARAYAHVGAVRALRERGVVVDFVGGTSMGAIIAACVAMGWSDVEIERRIRDGFVASNPLGDHVLPVVALTRGARVEERLRRHFGDVMIEDLEIPFFCVSTDLAAGASRVHRRGRLADALRASIALPGILPPVADQESLLVDGAIMNNFPTDLMAGFHRGLTIGVDVAVAERLAPSLFVNPPGFIDWVLANGLRSAPPIVSLLMRAATVRQELRHADRPADILIEPKVVGVDLRDWRKYEIAVADGYRETIAALDASSDRLSPLIAAAR